MLTTRRPSSASARARAFSLGFLLVLGASRRAAACTDDDVFSSCIDADASWLPPSATRFLGIDAARVLPGRTWIAGAGVSYLARPLELHVTSPDPEGRTVAVVDDALNASAFAALGVGSGVELDATLPFTVHQTGAGVQGITTQQAEPLRAQALRDPRLGASVGLLQGISPWSLSSKAILRVALPLGSDDALAGDRSFVVAPGSTWGVEPAPFFASVHLGARLRKVTKLGTARLGSQLVAALGFGVDIFPNQLLSASAEATALPVLASQSSRTPGGTRVEGRLIPAEWLLSARSQPFRASSLSVQLGAGTALPLSAETRNAPDGSSDSDHFAGITSPRYRIVLAVRYGGELSGAAD
jgi:hypothetical protein